MWQYGGAGSGWGRGVCMLQHHMIRSAQHWLMCRPQANAASTTPICQCLQTAGDGTCSLSNKCRGQAWLLQLTAPPPTTPLLLRFDTRNRAS
jgi:hypothetical protein